MTLPHLTKKETALFNMLDGKDGVSIGELVCIAPHTFNGSNLVAVHIRNLRKKLAKTHTIKSIHGWGYRMTAI